MSDPEFERIADAIEADEFDIAFEARVQRERQATLKDERLECMEQALSHYAASYCAGWCQVVGNGGQYGDCAGCIARLALAAGTRSAETACPAQSEGCQSGGDQPQRPTSIVEGN